jgi:hypothetical protein
MAELRKLRRQFLSTLAAGAAIFVLMPVIRLASGRLGNVLGLGVFFARRCVNCGLQKWVASEPDPKLKRELRDDSILKLE